MAMTVPEAMPVPSGIPARREAPAPTAGPSLGDACRLLPGGVLLVPAEQCLLIPVSLPARRSRDIVAALPFVLEERLAQDLEQVRYAWRRDADAVMVLVCERARLREWAEGLPADTDAGAVRIVPDVLSLPLETGRWSLCLLGQRLLVRTGPCSGFASELSAAPALLQAQCRQSSLPEGLLVVRGEGLTEPTGILDLLEREFGLRSDGHDHDWPREIATTRVPCLKLTEETPARVAPTRRTWLLAVLLLGAAAALQPGLMWWQGSRLEARHQALEARTLKLLHEAFPDIRRVVNPRIQARQGLRRLRERLRSPAGDVGLLPLMLAVGTAMQALPGIRIQRFRYRDGGLELHLRAPDIARVDSLQAALVQHGLRAELVSARIPEQGGGPAAARHTLASLRVWRP